MAVTLTVPETGTEPALTPPRITWNDGVATDETGRVVALRVAFELGEPWAAWLAARASAWGDTVADHAAAILRHYWASHDEWRHRQGQAATQPAGAPREP